MQQIVEMDNPLGGELLLQRLDASESLSFLFEYRLDLLSPREDIDADELLGKNISIKLALSDGGSRYFTGYLTEFSSGGVVGGLFSYYAVLRPWTWFLTRASDCRIFQDKKIPEIIRAMFDKHSHNKSDKKGLGGDYKSWEYCVQYRESDFNFVSRLMEHEGIYYYFKHDDHGHTLMMVDGHAAHSPVPGFEKFSFYSDANAMNAGIDCIRDWRSQREIRSGKYDTVDYDFKNPGLDLKSSKDLSSEPALISQAEVFDYPGGFVRSEHGEAYAGIRLEEIQTAHQCINGSGNTRAMQVGTLFTLERHPVSRQNAKYLVTRLNSQINVSGYEPGEDSGVKFTCQFSAIPADQQFRPRRVTPKPVVQGPQTAVVVGPAGQEIHVDKYGRVKVHFFWNRHDDRHENSSCWIRVSQPWAGRKFGMLANPRIDQEVIVDFLEGDPDQPIITGRVYNGDQMPPYELPLNATQTGIRSRTSPGGSNDNCNEIRFEDKKGAEQFVVSAEKDMIISVKNDSTRTVNIDDSTTVLGNQSVQIEGNQTVTITGTVGESVTGKVTNTYGNGKFETVKNGIAEYSTSFKNVFVDGWHCQKVTGKSYTHSSDDMVLATEGLFHLFSKKNTQIDSRGDLNSTASNFNFSAKDKVEFVSDEFDRTMKSCNDTVLGPTNDFFAGQASDIYMGLSTSTFLGLKLDSSAALNLTCDFGATLTNAIGIEMKNYVGPSFENKIIEIESKAMAYEMAGLKIFGGGGGSATELSPLAAEVIAAITGVAALPVIGYTAFLENQGASFAKPARDPYEEPNPPATPEPEQWPGWEQLGKSDRRKSYASGKSKIAREDETIPSNVDPDATIQASPQRGGDRAKSGAANKKNPRASAAVPPEADPDATIQVSPSSPPRRKPPGGGSSSKT